MMMMMIQIQMMMMMNYHHHHIIIIISIIITMRSSSLSSLPNNSTAAKEFIFASFKQVVTIFFNFINSSLQMITNSSLVRVKRISLSLIMCSTVTEASGSFIIKTIMMKIRMTNGYQ